MKQDKSFYNVLDDFNVTDYSVYPRNGKVIFNESNFRQKLLCVPYYIGMRGILQEKMNKQVKYKERWHDKLEKSGIYWFRRGGWNLQKSYEVNKFVSGCFEDPIYFDCIRSTLLSEFTPKKGMLTKNIDLMNKIQQTNSICLSVRRGDFESNAEVRRLQSVCDRNYFEASIQEIKNRINHPVFSCFQMILNGLKKTFKQAVQHSTRMVQIPYGKSSE